MMDEHHEKVTSASPQNQMHTEAQASGLRSGQVPYEEVRSENEVSLLELANVLLKRWKLVVGLPLGTALAAALVSLVIPAKYTATAAFVPETESQRSNLPSGMAGIAAQFGIGIGGSGPNSPRFYADVLRSRTLKDQVLLADFRDFRGNIRGDSATLLDILRIKGDGERERLENGRKRLDKTMSVRVNNETNIVTVSVETRYPALSADVVNLLIDLLNSFNLETRRSNAAERRTFIEGRVTEAGRELRETEEELKSFLERNRQFESSPELQFQHDRLQRQVSIKQEVLTMLRRQYEEARIQEVNDTPVITVIDRAVSPEKKSRPRRKLWVILALLGGGVVAMVTGFGQEFVERARETDKEEFHEFSYRWKAIRAEIRSALSPVRRKQ